MSNKRGHHKSLSNQNLRSIDIKHSELLNKFEKIELEVIPALLSEKEILKKSVSTLNESQLEEFMKIKDRLNEIKNELKTLKKEKKKYLLDNSTHVFEYFEQKQQISNDSNTINQNTQVLNSFFKIKATNTESEDLSNDKYIQSKKSYLQYWSNVNNEIQHIQSYIIPTDICNICRKGEMIALDEEGILVCNNDQCGKFNFSTKNEIFF